MTLTDNTFSRCNLSSIKPFCCSEKIWDVKNICHNKHKKHRPAVTNGKYSKGSDLKKKLINFTRIITLNVSANDPSHIKLFQYNLVLVSLRTKDASAILTKNVVNCYKINSTEGVSIASF